MSTDVVVTTPPKTPITVGSRGLQLTTLDEMWRFAQAVAVSGLAPKGLERPETIFIALEMGAEVGLPPMAALQNIAVINGRPSLWGDAMLAVCRSSGVFDEGAFDEQVVEKPNGAIEATCTVRRLPNGKPVVRSFTLAEAKAAGLAGKQGPWSQYPRRMLQLRARSWALRDGFADVLRGFRAAEEEADLATVVATPEPPLAIPRDRPAASRLDQLMARLATTSPHQAVEDAAARKVAAGPNGTDPEPPPVDESQEWSPEVVRREEEAIAGALASAANIKAVETIRANLGSNPNLDGEALGRLDRLCTAMVADIKASRGERSNKGQRSFVPDESATEVGM